ncbi:3-methyl-2-oxobutanoate hydroxymethyltransferase OS=Castellaniella defragrans OX=75697 GN=panB PE=3 SV=1 [Castellaniella defragrans]
MTEDILGLSGDRIPKFAQRFGDAAQVIHDAARRYAQSVREGTFPTLDQCFGVHRSK